MGKLFLYTLRLYDELAFARHYSDSLGIEFKYSEDYPDPSNIALAEGCDVVSVTPCDMGASMIDAFHGVGIKHIACRSIGYDHVDRERARSYGMRISNVSYPADGVADYAIMLMLNLLRRFPSIMKRTETQDYSLKGKMGGDITRRTVGIIGTGRIGTTVVRHLSGFGCRILAYDLYPNEEAARCAEYVPLETLLSESDIISLHCNATDENYHLIRRETLALMKPGAMIVNTARGKLIDTDDLIDALESGRIGGAALDVLENENGLYYYDRTGDVIANRGLAVLRTFPNVIVSPHTAFYTDVNVGSMIQSVFESAYAFIHGLPTEHEVFG